MPDIHGRPSRSWAEQTDPAASTAQKRTDSGLPRAPQAGGGFDPVAAYQGGPYRTARDVYTMALASRRHRRLAGPPEIPHPASSTNRRVPT